MDEAAGRPSCLCLPFFRRQLRSKASRQATSHGLNTPAPGPEAQLAHEASIRPFTSSEQSKPEAGGADALLPRLPLTSVSAPGENLRPVEPLKCALERGIAGPGDCSSPCSHANGFTSRQPTTASNGSTSTTTTNTITTERAIAAVGVTVPVAHVAPLVRVDCRAAGHQDAMPPSPHADGAPGAHDALARTFRRTNSAGAPLRKPSLLSRPQLASERPTSTLVPVHVAGAAAVGNGTISNHGLGVGVPIPLDSTASSFTMGVAPPATVELASAQLPTLHCVAAALTSESRVFGVPAAASLTIGPDILSSIFSEGCGCGGGAGTPGGGGGGGGGASSFAPSSEMPRSVVAGGAGCVPSVLNLDTGHVSTTAVEALRHQLLCDQRQGIGGRPLEVDNLEKVGQGSFGVVYRGVWQGAHVAIKYLLSSSDQQLAASATEALLSRLLAHPNVVQTFACKVVELTPEWFDPERPSASRGYATSDSGAVLTLPLPPGTATGTATAAAAAGPDGAGQRHTHGRCSAGPRSHHDHVHGHGHGGGHGLSRQGLGCCCGQQGRRCGGCADCAVDPIRELGDVGGGDGEGGGEEPAAAPTVSDGGGSGGGRCRCGPHGSGGDGEGRLREQQLRAELGGHSWRRHTHRLSGGGVGGGAGALRSGGGGAGALRSGGGGAGALRSGGGGAGALRSGGSVGNGAGGEAKAVLMPRAAADVALGARTDLGDGAEGHGLVPLPAAAAPPPLLVGGGAAAVITPRLAAVATARPAPAADVEAEAGEGALFGGADGGETPGTLETFHSGDGFGLPYLGGGGGDDVGEEDGCRVSPSTFRRYRALLGDVRARPHDVLTQLIMEYCDRGSLQRAIDKQLFRASPRWNARVALRALLRTAREVAQGMCHLHASQIVHGDLKPGNVLLKSSRADRRGFVAKVADFGLSRLLHGADRSHLECDPDGTGTLAYMAPEVLNGSMCPAADVYSFGVMLWQLVTGERPFADVHPGRMWVGVCSGALRLEWPADVHPLVRKLGGACLAHDKRMRPSFTRVARGLGVIETVVRNEGAAAAAAASAHQSSSSSWRDISVSGSMRVGAVGAVSGVGGMGPDAAAQAPCAVPALLSGMGCGALVGGGNGGGGGCSPPVCAGGVAAASADPAAHVLLAASQQRLLQNYYGQQPLPQPHHTPLRHPYPQPAPPPMPQPLPYSHLYPQHPQPPFGCPYPAPRHASATVPFATTPFPPPPTSGGHLSAGGGSQCGSGAAGGPRSSMGDGSTDGAGGVATAAAAAAAAGGRLVANASCSSLHGLWDSGSIQPGTPRSGAAAAVNLQHHIMLSGGVAAGQITGLPTGTQGHRLSSSSFGYVHAGGGGAGGTVGGGSAGVAPRHYTASGSHAAVLAAAPAPAGASSSGDHYATYQQYLQYQHQLLAAVAQQHAHQQQLQLGQPQQLGQGLEQVQAVGGPLAYQGPGPALPAAPRSADGPGVHRGGSQSPLPPAPPATAHPPQPVRPSPAWQDAPALAAGAAVSPPPGGTLGGDFYFSPGATGGGGGGAPRVLEFAPVLPRHASLPTPTIVPVPSAAATAVAGSDYAAGLAPPSPLLLLASEAPSPFSGSHTPYLAGTAAMGLPSSASHPYLAPGASAGSFASAGAVAAGRTDEHCPPQTHTLTHPSEVCRPPLLAAKHFASSVIASAVATAATGGVSVHASGPAAPWQSGEEPVVQRGTLSGISPVCSCDGSASTGAARPAAFGPIFFSNALDDGPAAAAAAGASGPCADAQAANAATAAAAAPDQGCGSAGAAAPLSAAAPDAAAGWGVEEMPVEGRGAVEAPGLPAPASSGAGALGPGPAGQAEAAQGQGQGQGRALERPRWLQSQGLFGEAIPEGEEEGA